MQSIVSEVLNAEPALHHISRLSHALNDLQLQVIILLFDKLKCSGKIRIRESSSRKL